MPTINPLDIKREELHAMLCAILTNQHVYYQPLESVRLSYPAIVYERMPFDIKHADNRLYMYSSKYQVTYIAHVPDDAVILSLLSMQSCSMTQSFVSDNLYHYVFNIYH